MYKHTSIICTCIYRYSHFYLCLEFYLSSTSVLPVFSTGKDERSEFVEFFSKVDLAKEAYRLVRSSEFCNTIITIINQIVDRKKILSFIMITLSPKLMCSDPFPAPSASSTRLAPLGETPSWSLGGRSPSWDLLLAESVPECSRDLTNASSLFSPNTGGGCPEEGVVEKKFMAELFFFSS